MSYRLRPKAETDLEAIVFHIAANSPQAAERWLTHIRQCFERLGDMPDLGVARPDIRPNLRMFPVGNYLVLYKRTVEGVEIVRIVHGARQWQDLL